ncbi:MAG: hypothetical protein B9S32_13950 [Verrucomicrobia bacterium Tous-C9LFEB]|nr:MAG: hypothetical protein B9S32_13950 [Verrucomicrobia bacterium Tous-C9LFEB]
MFSLLRRLLILAILLVVVAFLLRNQILTYGLKFGLKQTTGFGVKVETIDFSRFMPPVVFGYNLLVENPEDFEEVTALNVSRVEIIGPDDFWQNIDRPRLSRVKLDIAELAIVRNSTGKLNVLVMEESAKNNPGRLHPYPLIGELELSIDKVAFYDCYGAIGGVKLPPQIIRINLKGQRYRNVQNVAQLERLIIREGLKRAKFPTLDDTYRALDISLESIPAPTP